MARRRSWAAVPGCQGSSQSASLASLRAGEKLGERGGTFRWEDDRLEGSRAFFVMRKPPFAQVAMRCLTERKGEAGKGRRDEESEV